MNNSFPKIPANDYYKLVKICRNVPKEDLMAFEAIWNQSKNEATISNSYPDGYEKLERNYMWQLITFNKKYQDFVIVAIANSIYKKIENEQHELSTQTITFPITKSIQNLEKRVVDTTGKKLDRTIIYKRALEEYLSKLNK